MSKLDVFFSGKGFDTIDITIHRKIVDEFTDQYFDSDEFLDDIHNCSVIDQTLVEENIQLLRLMIKHLYHVSVFSVLKNDLMLVGVEEFPKIINKLKLDLLASPIENTDDIPLITADEFYDYMLSFDNVYQRYIVDKVHDVDIRIKNDLLLSIQNHDKERYHRTIDCIPYDISNVFKLAYMIHLLDDLVFNFLKACKDEDWSILKDHPIANILKEKIKEYEKKLASLDEDSEERFILLEDVIQFSLMLFKLGFEYLLSMVPAFMQKYIISKIPPKTYEIYKDIKVPENISEFFDYYTNPRDYIMLGIENNSLEQQSDSNSLPKPTTESDEKAVLYPDSPYGFIPEDYFSQKIDKANPEDHYDLKDDIQNEGEEKFAEFINYVAKCQYIENNNKTKALFAYRLTGRLRPAEEDLKPIIWCGADNKPEELLYTIRYITTSNRPGMYSKLMKAFFEGPDWPSKGCSSKADDAKTEFRQTLNSIFGDVCGMKYNTKRKKRH